MGITKDNVFENILEDLKENIELLKAIEKWNLEAVKLVWDIMLGVIERIEFYSEELEDLNSEEKKDMAAELLNKLIDIPYMPEWLEAKLFDFSIDGAVQILNNLFGHKWLKDIKNN
jgi:hypothetical protein